MTPKIIELSSTTREGLDTEIKFNIASAKVDGCEILVLSFPDDNANPRLCIFINKILSSLKRAGIILFYLFDSELNEFSTQGSFLINKYPAICDIFIEGQNIVFIKL